jgi:predicted Zn-dependent protease
VVVAAMLWVLCVGLATAAPSNGATITYRNSSRHAEEVTAAVQAWNRAGLRVRFIKAHPGRRVDLRFVDYTFDSELTQGEMVGRVIRLKRSAPRLGGAEPLLRPMGTTVAHEIGHFLGLRHPRRRNRCTVMYPGADPHELDRCPGNVGEWAACGPQRSDVMAVARRYGWRRGGRAKLRTRNFGRCRIADGPGGARFVRSMCGPERVALFDVDGESVTGVLEFSEDNDPLAPNIVAFCTWKISGPENEAFVMTVERISPGGEMFPGDRPSGDCDGARSTRSTQVHSRSRYITVNATESRFQPVDPLAMADATLIAAENAGVGLPCVIGT